jgi:hypothetical protein
MQKKFINLFSVHRDRRIGTWTETDSAGPTERRRSGALAFEATKSEACEQSINAIVAARARNSANRRRGSAATFVDCVQGESSINGTQMLC